LDLKDVDARHKAGHDESEEAKQKGPGKTGAFENRWQQTNQRE
jgi:hypothetical protein